MKKLALSLAVLFAVGMVSCSDNKKAEECDSNCPDTAVEVVEEGVAVEEGNDSVANDTAVVAEEGAAVENAQ